MRRRRLINLMIGGTTLLLMTQCHQKAASPSPKAEGFDPPISPMLSYLSATVTIPLSELEAKINRELDPVLVGKGAGKKQKGSLFPFSVVRSGPVRIQYVNQQVTFSAPLQVQLPKPFSSAKGAPAENPFCSIRVNFRSPLTLTPAWRLSSQVKFAGYEWTVKPQIRLLGKTISLENFAQRLLQKHQSSIETAIDSAVYNELRLDKLVRPIWQDIQKPLLINKQYGLWLLPKPVSVAASPIQGDNTQVTTLLRIALNTQTEIKPQKPVHPPNQLPDLQKREPLSQQSALRLISFVPYSDINWILNRTLQAKNKLLLGTLTVNHASVYGGQRSVIIKTKVSGLFNETLYLRGRPVFDSETNTLHVDNVDFDAQTKDALSKLSGTVLHDALCNLVEGLLTIPLGEEIAQLPQKIDAAFEKSKAGKKTDLSIKSFRFVPQTIAVRPDGIQALIKVESKVALKVQKL